MSRLQLLLPLLIWAAWLKGTENPSAVMSWDVGVPVFVGGYLAALTGLTTWAGRVARRVGPFGAGGKVRRFHQVLGVARLGVSLWYGAGVYVFGWGMMILPVVRPLGLPIDTPATLLAITPALLAWMALWLVQFPVDRAVREQNLLIRLDEELPVHAPPGLGTYFAGQLRLQLLLTLVPVLLVLALEDVGVMAMTLLRGTPSEELRLGLTFGAIGMVFLIAPLLLRHVLPTEPLADGPLRQRLEATCRRLNLKYREILVWRTHFTLVNAAVMGVVPQVRYILLSDLLLETMDDRQVEAVFAHEAGHVVHRHMAWYLLFIAVFILCAQGIDGVVGPWVDASALPTWVPWGLLTGLAGMAGFVLAFGSLSRRFERQADVFAARSLALNDSHPRHKHVDAYGAELFNSALARLALVNNIPIGAPSSAGPAPTMKQSVARWRSQAANWWHGSIHTRMDYLRRLSDHPSHTSHFDRQMRAIRLVLVFAFCASVAWVTVTFIRA